MVGHVCSIETSNTHPNFIATKHNCHAIITTNTHDNEYSNLWFSHKYTIWPPCWNCVGLYDDTYGRDEDADANAIVFIVADRYCQAAIEGGWVEGFHKGYGGKNCECGANIGGCLI